MTQFGVAITADGVVEEGRRSLADVLAEAPEVDELPRRVPGAALVDVPVDKHGNPEVSE